MRRLLPLFALALVPAFLPARDEPKAIKLFNGKDLSGWTTFFKDDKKADDCFTAKGGVIECTGAPLGYLVTEKEYGDYKLELEWKWGEGAKKVKVPNSGVLLHLTGKDAIWPKCVEAQLMAGNAGDFWLMGGSKLMVDEARHDKDRPRHFYKMKTDKPVEKEVGGWNKYEIVCKGGAIKLTVNGVLLNEGTGGDLKKGKIALQSEGAPISFRNIVLTPLE